MKNNKAFDYAAKKQVYREIFRLGISPKILVGGHLMVEFRKETEPHEVGESLVSRHKEFGAT